MIKYRELTTQENEVIEKYLLQLRQVFKAWSDDYKDEYDLLCFAYYEGCHEEIMEESAPYVVGNSLVEFMGFQWVMVEFSNSWHYGVCHRDIETPIDLLTLREGYWYRPENEDQDDPPCAGEIILRSRDTISLFLRWVRAYEANILFPKRTLREIEEMVSRKEIFGRMRK